MLPAEPLTHKRAAIGRAERDLRRKPGDPEAAARVQQVRSDYRAAKAEAYIRELVDAAPPLSEAQRQRLAALLRPSAAA